MSSDDCGGGTIAEYRVLIVDTQHVPIRSIVRVAMKRPPAKGEGIPIDGRPYRIVDVWHPKEERNGENDSFSQFEFTDLLLVVQEEAPPPWWRSGWTAEDDDLPLASAMDETGGSSTPSSDPSALLIPFRAVELNPASPLRPFCVLIACVVWSGYKEQTLAFEHQKFRAWRMEWNGECWSLDEVSDARSAKECRELSRAAKRCEVAAEVFLTSLTPLTNDLVDLVSYRRRRGN